MRALDRFQRFALLTTLATYALIAIGGLVRATGSGLGCPDWPKCFDRWIPPFRASDVPAHIDPVLFNVAKAWTEYINRLVGVVVGFLIFGTLLLAVTMHRRSPRILWPTFAAFILVGIEGFIGGKVVASKLSPIVLTVHLTLALVIVSLLLYATVCAFFPGGRPRIDLPRSRIALGRIAVGVMILTLVQIGIGATLRGEVQLAGAADLPRGAWLAATSTIRHVHESFSIIVACAIGGIVWFLFQRADPDPWLKRAALLAASLVVLQVLAGVGLKYFELPMALQVAHLWIGSLLLGALTSLVLLVYRTVR